MLKWLFGEKKIEAARGDDSVWMTHAARLTGMAREAGILAEAERSVVVVALSLAALDELEAALAQHQPARCTDIFGKDALRASLAKPGAVAVALPAALEGEMKASIEEHGVDIMVCGRNDTRAADDAILAFADALGPNAHATFHLSLEDPLLKDMASGMGGMLEKLGMKADQPIEHAMVTRAIRNAQEKRSG